MPTSRMGQDRLAGGRSLSDRPGWCTQGHHRPSVPLEGGGGSHGIPGSPAEQGETPAEPVASGPVTGLQALSIWEIPQPSHWFAPQTDADFWNLPAAGGSADQGISGIAQPDIPFTGVFSSRFRRSRSKCRGVWRSRRWRSSRTCRGGGNGHCPPRCRPNGPCRHGLAE